MSVLLDTRDLPAAERRDALDAVLNRVSRPTGVQVTPDVHAVFRAWDLDGLVTVMQLDVQATELRITRSPKHLAIAGSERLSVAFNSTGCCVTTNHDREETRNNALRLTDLTATYRIVQRGRCRAAVVELDHARLGLSVDQVRRGIAGAGTSPLHAVVRRHVLAVASMSSTIAPEAAADVAAATVHLVRGLLNSVSPLDRDRREARAATLRLRIEDFVRQHLSDTSLTPATVAAAHHISLRRLYLLLAATGQPPAEWIIRLRLEAARQSLLSPGATVADTAYAWGFKDHSHFTRRFKSAYGLTPTEYMSRE